MHIQRGVTFEVAGFRKGHSAERMQKEHSAASAAVDVRCIVGASMQCICMPRPHSLCAVS